MPETTFAYNPENLAVGDKAAWVSCTDGDTPTIQVPVRMLGIDAPELHYKGAQESNPGKFDAEMEAFLSNAGQGLHPELQAHLAPLLSDLPCTRQIRAGDNARRAFAEMAARRLERIGKNGQALTPARLFVMVSEEVFDHHGRFLAYINRAYSKQERNDIPESKRPTFNLQMLQEGQAVSLLIYPNFPKPHDLELLGMAVANARDNEKGMWSDGEATLLPYEFRWIVDTIQGTRRGPDRYCADSVSGKLYPPELYFRVKPEDRLFFFKEDVTRALEMGFVLQS